MFLKDLAEIARILIAAGGGNRIDLGIALTQHVSCMTQAAFRQVGAERGAAPRKEFVEIADAQPQLPCNLADGDRFCHVRLYVPHGVQEIAAHGLFRGKCQAPIRQIVIIAVRFMTTAHDMPSGEFDRGRKLLIIQRLEEVGTYAEGNRLLCILKLPESRQDNVLGIDLLAQAGNDIKPRHPRHLDVHDQHIGMVFPRHEDALHPAGGRTDHLRTKILPRG